MKIYVTKTSDWDFCEIREYADLKEAVDDLLNPANFPKSEPEIVVSSPREWMSDEVLQCDYAIEIYDTWRE